MHFYERDSPATYSKILGVAFRLANGQDRREEIAVTQHSFEDHPDLIGIAKRQLQRKAESAMRKSAEEQRMATLNNWLGGATAAVANAWQSTTSTQGYQNQMNQIYNERLDATYADNQAWYYYPQYGATTVVDNTISAVSASWSVKVKIKYRDGKRELIIEKDYDSEGIEITPEDIMKARMDYIKNARINIIARRAEHKAEDLLRMLVSEVDFRSYKEKGYFTVKAGNKVYRIWKDSHKWIDCFEQSEGGVLIPHNRLCTHTLTRELPKADEAVQKLMLIRSNRVLEHSNGHGIGDLKPIKERELVLA